MSLAFHGQSIQTALGLLQPSSKEPLNILNQLVIDEVKQHHNLLEITAADLDLDSRKVKAEEKFANLDLNTLGLICN